MEVAETVDRFLEVLSSPTVFVEGYGRPLQWPCCCLPETMHEDLMRAAVVWRKAVPALGEILELQLCPPYQSFPPLN